jgi:hypothetical protein
LEIGIDMPNFTARLPLQNESSAPVKVLLEPLSEYFIVQPGQSIEIYAVFDDSTSNTAFTVAPNDSFLTIYAPGEISGFVDCYATCDGVRLAPDGS